jgi:hypothetical protein
VGGDDGTIRCVIDLMNGDEAWMDGWVDGITWVFLDVLGQWGPF